MYCIGNKDHFSLNWTGDIDFILAIKKVLKKVSRDLSKYADDFYSIFFSFPKETCDESLLLRNLDFLNVISALKSKALKRYGELCVELTCGPGSLCRQPGSR